MIIISEEARQQIIKWIDTQITFNPLSISDTKALEFFGVWQRKHLPDHPYIILMSTLVPNICRYAWTVYLCTSESRFKQFQKNLFEPVTNISVLWSDFVLRGKNHIIQVKITADTVNNIVVEFE